MIKTIGIIVIGLLLITSTVYADEPPTLISPANNSTISSVPTFGWQTISGSTGYNILIDDEPTVTSPYAKTPYYPTNPTYSPQTLNPGTYYWKVKAKDSSGNWGNFSSIWSFTLVSSDPTPTATSNPTPSSTTTSTPTPASSSPSPSSNASAFTISNIPSQINSDQAFSVAVNLLLPNNSNTIFYLKGAFKKADGSNYFGQTKVNSSWVKNNSTYSEQSKITTDANGNWSYNLEVQPDSEDSGFTGTADYIFKVGRYTASGSGPTWSNEVTIKIISVESSEQGDSLINSSSYTGNPYTSPSVSPSIKNKSVISSQSKSYDRLVYHSASVAAATASATPYANSASEKLVKSQKQINIFAILGAVLVLSGITLSGYIYFKYKK